MLYCNALNAVEQAAGRVPPGYTYRLPTEAEWEFCCRAGTTTEFHYGSAIGCPDARIQWSDHSNAFCGATGPSPVATYLPNAWGLFDMHGNLGEWCIGALRTYTADPVTDPYVPAAVPTFSRGGGFLSDSNRCRSARRSSGDPGGFRVVLAAALP